MQKSNSMIDL